MKSSFRSIAALMILIGAPSCGGNVSVGTGGSSAGGTGTGAGGTGAGGTGSTTSTPLPGGDCQTGADCKSGKCAELTPGGYKVCLVFPSEATSCTAGMPISDQCCKTADCKQGKCYLSTDVPQCAGFQPQYNECAADECQTDANCNSAQSICAPAGAYGPTKRCITALCKTNADCTAQPGGVCSPIENPCCAVTQGLACVYPGGCHKQAECKNGQSCAINTPSKSASCSPNGIGCPL